MVAAVYLVLFALGIGCPIKYVTGISCPGCGMTRACLAALRLDFDAAFTYHPLWVTLLPVAFAALFFYAKQKKKALIVLAGLFVAAMLAVYGYRLLFTESEIVVFTPADGWLLRRGY
ncbi:MAG: DUF2752 domain-containing protein [Clostridia bacterium]|nr:DUF2752 domain-containing protein [Clostridia bacterium]